MIFFLLAYNKIDKKKQKFSALDIVESLSCGQRDVVIHSLNDKYFFILDVLILQLRIIIIILPTD